jgi:hypothetical protein
LTRCAGKSEAVVGGGVMAWPSAATMDDLSLRLQAGLEERVRSLTFFPDPDLLCPFFDRDFPLLFSESVGIFLF